MRNTFLPLVPISCKLAWGGHWFARNDFVGRHVFLGYWFENNEQRFLRKYFREGMTVLDIGAHQGFYTLLSSFLVGNSGRVISFEPSPRELKRLNLHLSANHCQNVTVESLALGKAETKSDLYICVGETGTGFNSLRPPAVPDQFERVEVSIVRLDNYLKQKQIAPATIDFIKLDVEGGELDILQGANDLLNCPRRPVIMCEAEDIRTHAWGYKAKAIVELLKQRNFSWFAVTIDGLLKAVTEEDFPQGNVIAVPAERLSSIEKFIDS
jgi:FkbM family methyltransferase